jgi:uncharacterized membrane protein
LSLHGRVSSSAASGSGRVSGASRSGRRGDAFFARVEARHLVYLTVVAGALLRLAQYLANTSLSLDESLLALNIRHKTISQLFDRLDFNQAAPPGFLAVQKAGVALLGDSEYALRAFPLVASVASVIAFPLLARMVLSETMTFVSTALFGVAGALVDYAATAKQYGVDVFAAVVLSWLGLRATQRRSSGDVAIVAVVGLVVVWFSHPAAFVLLGVGVALIGQALVRREPRQAGAMAGICLVWLGSFAGAYALSHASVYHIQESFRGSSAFVSPTHPGRMRDYFGLFRYAAGIPHASVGAERDVGDYIAAVAAVLFVLGVRSLLLRARVAAAIIYLPLAAAGIASLLGKYPLIARTTLFAAPAVLIGIAAGTETLTKQRRPRIRVIAGFVMAAIVGLSMVLAGAWHVGHPYRHEEMKPVLRYLARSQRPGDTVYLLYTSQYAFRYYLECGCFETVTVRRGGGGIWPLSPYVGRSSQWAPALLSHPPQFFVGSYEGTEAHRYVVDVGRLRGRSRVWVVVSDIPSAERKSLLHGLDRLGGRLASFRARGDDSAAGVYLYDFRR